MRFLVASVSFCFLLLGPVSARAGQHSKSQSKPSEIGRRDITQGDLNLYSPQNEIEMGKEMAKRIEELVTLFNDPETQDYMQELTDRIARHSDAKFPIQVKVIYSNQVDAFALPGGYLFVNTGLILRTRTEAELAGVIAHEVAHIADRDATRQMSQQEVLEWVSLPLLMVGGPVGFAIRGSIALAGPLQSSVFNRRAEKKADFLGLQYLYESGYDPGGFIDFFERVRKLEKDPQGLIARAFSSHPLTKDRMTAAEREIEKDLPSRPQYVVTTSQYQNIRNHLEQMMRNQMTVIPEPTPRSPVLQKSAVESQLPSKGQP